MEKKWRYEKKLQILGWVFHILPRQLCLNPWKWRRLCQSSSLTTLGVCYRELLTLRCCQDESFQSMGHYWMQWRSRDWDDLACKAGLGEVKVQRVAGGQRTAVLTSCENYGLTHEVNSGLTSCTHYSWMVGGVRKQNSFDCNLISTDLWSRDFTHCTFKATLLYAKFIVTLINVCINPFLFDGIHCMYANKSRGTH